MPITIPGNRTITLASKAGGGFQSAGLVSVPSGSGLTDAARLFSLSRAFEGTPGVVTRNESDGFDGADGRTVYSTEQKYAGTTSGKMTLATTDSDGGFGQWGGIVDLPIKLQEGDELFFRCRLFFESGFEFYPTDSNHTKFFRFRTETPTGDNKGYADVYWHYEDALEPFLYKYIKEVSPNQWSYFGPKSTYSNVAGQWQTWNIHVVWHSDAATGRFRLWRDNNLLADEEVVTLSAASDVVTAFYLFTYYNGVVPKEQSCFIDDLVITSDRSETVIDSASGYSWIGV